MPVLCRDCCEPFDAGARCPGCGSPRVLSHPELFSLSIAHLDCDAFYASVEKRDDPSLAARPVIVGGGGRRGVVSTACYIARTHGVRSAMPMFQALRLCPDAVVIAPRHAHYAGVSARMRAMMEVLTPLIEPLALDEAFLDLTGTARLHRAPPAVLLVRLARRMERELGVSGSIGLSHNRFLAKIASDLDKPRGFAVIGRAETAAFLAPRSVRVIPGVGAATLAALDAAGIRSLADLRRWERADLIARYGSQGGRLHDLARGIDPRPVRPDRPVRSISNETTFDTDLGARDLLEGHLWRLAEKVTDRAKARGLGGRTVTLKLKRPDHGVLTRRVTLAAPTQLADRVYPAAAGLLAQLGAGAGPWRLIGVGLGDLVPAAQADGGADLFDPGAAARARAERARDAIRARFGPGAIVTGRALR